MGNCIRLESSRDRRWADDDEDRWESAEKGRGGVVLGKRMKEEEGALLDRSSTDHDGTGFTAKGIRSSSSLTEVKIKITKKQLQQLLGKMKEDELSVHEALAQLIRVSDHQHHSHERPWRPVLQSIPEMN